MLRGEAINANCIVFNLTRLGIEPPIHCTICEHDNNYTIYTVWIYGDSNVFILYSLIKANKTENWVNDDCIIILYLDWIATSFIIYIDGALYFLLNIIATGSLHYLLYLSIWHWIISSIYIAWKIVSFTLYNSNVTKSFMIFFSYILGI